MSEGTILISVFTSDARIPIEGAEVTVQTDTQTFRALTDDSGQTAPITVGTPPFAESQSPSRLIPYATMTVTARRSGYRTQTAVGVQIFPDTQTRQDFMLMPTLTEGTAPDILTPPQNL